MTGPSGNARELASALNTGLAFRVGIIAARNPATCGFGQFGLNDLLRTVDMLDLRPDHLGGAQAAAVAEIERGADHEVAGDGQRPKRIRPA